ncbi:hypothetical protein DFJ63DRAFT_319733 [Scheffersomyces coipomensis]|uniref:uncharacterized protein n=1 Tax=Scheffersomyces coipomensis TaxID=1788519 RepID=UPI00315D135C
MGKSLRSKSKLKAKSVKRKGVFAEFVDNRNARLAKKDEESTKKQAKESAKESDKIDQDTAIVDDEDATPAKKISTSGWRDSRGQIYKKKQIKNKKNKTVKF